MSKTGKLADRNQPKEMNDEFGEIIPRGSRNTTVFKAKGSIDYHEENFTRDVEHYKIIGATDPFNFCMVKDTREGRKVFTCLEKLKELQESAEIHEKVVGRLERFRIYLAFDESTKQWHRARLLRFSRTANKLLVFFVDYPLLKMAYTDEDSLRELPDIMVGYPVVPMYKAHLYDVIPDPGGFKWKEEIAEWFQKRAKQGSAWVGLQMSWKATQVDKGPDQSIQVGVVLFEDNDLPERSRSLNFRLVRCGFGLALGIGATHLSNLFLPELEPMFSLANMSAPPNTDWCVSKLPVFVGKRWPQVGIRTVQGPNRIYVFLLCKYKEFQAMQMELRKNFKSGIPKVDCSQVKIGLGCLVGFKNPRTQEFDVHRSVVVRVNGPKTVEVILVDVGEIYTVPVSTIYALPKRVKLIPAFVHRLHLKNLQPPTNHKFRYLRWADNIDSEFNRLIEKIGYGLSGGENKPAWFAMRLDIPTYEHVVALRDVHEDLIFNQISHTWEGVSVSSTNGGNLHNYEPQPMIQNHLLSFGVDLLLMRKQSKIEQEEELKWEFESLAKIIEADKECFRAELVREGMNTEVYYDNLIKHLEKQRG